jgi:GDP-D-mannose dehydratase
MTKRALITVIAGRDGSLLAELLLEKGYEVDGATEAARPSPLMSPFPPRSI